MKRCFLFPGQGAQYPGMARDLWESSSKARELFQAASETLAMDMKKLLFDSSAEELKATDKTQVAMTLACLCSSAVLREKGIVPDACAGFSLGEYAALCEAGVLRIEDVFPIVRTRGELMEKASKGLSTADGAPGMAAVLGMPAEKVVSTLAPLSASGIFAANHNSPSQVVVSGTAQGLALAEKELKAAGAKRLVRLHVSGDEARRLCGEQLVSMVRWVEVQQGLLQEGCDRFFETGPGTVLTGLMKALNPGARCAPAGTREAIDKALEEAA